MQLLLERGECSVEELAGICGVSDMTIRRDLQKLAEAGHVVRTHGGASPGNQVSFEFQFLRAASEGVHFAVFVPRELSATPSCGAAQHTRDERACENETERTSNEGHPCTPCTD